MFKNTNRKKLIDIALILIITFLVIRLIGDIEFVVTSLKRIVGIIFHVFSIFLFGFSIAYVLNPAVKSIRKLLKCNKIIAISIVYTLAISFIGFLIFAIFPSIIKNIKDIAMSIPNYVNTATDYISRLTEGLPSDIKESLNNSANNAVNSIFDSIKSFQTINIISDVLGSATSVLLNSFISIILSIYMLYNKETLQNGFKTSVMALFGAKKSKKIYNIGSRINLIFNEFIIGRVLTSSIVFALCLVVFLILNIPYSFLCATIIGVTNMIPFFGSIIGTVPTVFIVLLIDPWKALWMLISIIVIQQVEGLIIGPKILGSKLGIDGVLILAGVLLGEQLFGTIGLFIGVPLIAAIKILIYDEYIKPLAVKREKANISDASPAPADDKRKIK